MAFPKDKNSSNGTDKKFGNVIAEDDKSNINWQKGGQKIGLITGRLKFGKQSVASLNTGVCTYQDDDSKGSDSY